MSSLRPFLIARPWLALLMVAAALCTKVVVPTGFMVSAEAKTFSVAICTGMLGEGSSRSWALPATGHHDDEGQRDGSKGAKSECPFAGQAFAVSGPLAALLAVAAAFAIEQGFDPVHAPEIRTFARLRPPLRAPPLNA